MLKLDQAPVGVSESAWAGAHGDPALGDLWLLSWDGEVLGLALITGVASSFVLVWPAGLRDSPSFSPAILVEASPLGLPMVTWPTRETGIGRHLLHRRLGPLLSPRTIVAVADALENGDEVPLPFAVANVAEEDREAASDAMVEVWEAICLHIWPEVQIGETQFDTDALRAIGIQPSGLAEALSVSVPDAVSLFTGESMPTSSQIETLADELGTTPEELLLSTLDEAGALLLEPRVKNDLLAIAVRYGVNEGEARALVRREFALAARSDGNPSSRLDAAIHRLLTAS